MEEYVRDKAEKINSIMKSLIGQVKELSFILRARGCTEEFQSHSLGFRKTTGY